MQNCNQCDSANHCIECNDPYFLNSCNNGCSDNTGDSDGDGVPDDIETPDGTNPNNGCEFMSSSQNINNVTTEWQLFDCDSDGLTNHNRQ